MKTFISIACYEDPDVIKTCESLIQSSLHEIRIVIILQTDSPERFEALKNLPVEVYSFPNSWAEGCGKARAEAFKHYDGENYVFQTDSHMRFVQDWDDLLINELQACDSRNPILTTLPSGFYPGRELGPCEVNYLGIKGFWNHLPLVIGYKLDEIPEVPMRTSLTAGGVLFAPGKICLDLEPDPYMYFHGEELLTSLRLWTKGYDFFCPRVGFCWHAYRTEVLNEKILEMQRRDAPLHERSVTRAHFLTGISQKGRPDQLIELGRYCLGTARTLSQWEEEFQISLREETFMKPEELLEKLKQDHRAR